MKLWVLIENTAREGFQAEHGLSLYLEVCGKRILFDAGQSDAFAHNAQKLGIDLSRVDLAILSHGHYDHGGGLAHFLARNSTAPVYLSRHAFEPHRNGAGKDIGLCPLLKDSGRLIYVDAPCSLGPGLRLSTLAIQDCLHPMDPAGLTMADGQPEDFRHEIYLEILENGQKILLSGCSHKGILNITAHFTPQILVGGFHFKHLATTDPRLATAGEQLRRLPTRYYTGHCTGQEQFDALMPILAHQLFAIHAGDFIEF